MKVFPIVAGLALAFALGACSGNAEEEMENAIRAELGNQANVNQVDQVELNTQADGNMTGYALAHDKAGHKNRFNCSAQPQADSKYKWQCTPLIDGDTERYLQEVMRPELAKQGEVVELVMKRKDDDNHMAGSAQVRTADGTVHDLACTAERKDATFVWRCEQPDAPATGGESDGDGEE